jgi:hypothetical protein
MLGRHMKLLMWLEQLQVRAVVALLHQPLVHQRAREDRVLVDGAVLHRATATPDDLLVLLEAPVEEVDLGRERVARGVAVEVRKVLVVGDGLVVHRQAQVLTEGLGQGGLARPDQPGDADEDVLESGTCAHGVGHDTFRQRDATPVPPRRAVDTAPRHDAHAVRSRK